MAMFDRIHTSLAPAPRLLKTLLAFHLSLCAWGCASQVLTDGDSGAGDIQSRALALDSREPFNNCDCGGEVGCECNDTASGGTTTIRASSIANPPEGSLASKADKTPSARSPRAFVVESSDSGRGWGAGSGLARAADSCRRALLRQKDDRDVAVESALRGQITVIQTTYATALAAEEDSYQDQLNGCGDTVSCFQSVEEEHKAAAALLISNRDADLMNARALAAAAHQKVTDDYNATVGDCEA